MYNCISGILEVIIDKVSLGSSIFPLIPQCFTLLQQVLIQSNSVVCKLIICVH